MGLTINRLAKTAIGIKYQVSTIKICQGKLAHECCRALLRIQPWSFGPLLSEGNNLSLEQSTVLIKCRQQ